MGTVWLLSGLVNAPVGTLRSAWWAVAAGLALTSVGMYVSERGLGWAEDDWAGVAAVGLLMLMLPLVVAATLLTRTAPAAVVASGLVGFGAGLACYRLVFGLVYSIPERRLERAGDRAV